MSQDEPTASPDPRNRHPDEAVLEGPAGDATPLDPTAAPQGRNRAPGAARPGEPAGDPVVGRLRIALDELTTGAEPNGARVMGLATRPRRWMLPAVVAAAVVFVAGIGIALAAGSSNTGPAAPTPSGSPVSTSPIIPWYELTSEGAVAEPPRDQTGTDLFRTQVWAAPDFSRVLVAVSSDPAGGTRSEPEYAEPPIGAVMIEDAPGEAWLVSSLATGIGSDIAPYVVWLPDDRTVVNVFGYGLDAETLRHVVLAGSLSSDDHGTRLDSPLSSLAPLADVPAPLRLVSQPYQLPDGTEASIMVAADGPAFVLRTYGSWADSITAFHTGFGDGFRIDAPGVSQMWWQVDHGAAWAGFAAPPDHFDELFGHLSRAADIPTPGPIAPSGPPAMEDACGLPPAPGSTTSTSVRSPHDLATLPGDTEPATTTTTSNPCSPRPTKTSIAPPAFVTTTSFAPAPYVTTTSVAPPSQLATTTSVSGFSAEPAMTAVAPSSFPGAGFKPPIAVGESVMLSAARAIGERGIELHASEAVQASDIAEQLESLRDTGRLGDMVIIQVGTNGAVSEADLERIMAAVAEVERVVVLTVHADRPWIAPNNELIRSLPSSYPNVVVVDWDQIATENPGVLASDGIHVQDRAVYADAIASAAGLT